MDITWLVIPLSLVPVALSVTATILFVRYPDHPLSIILFSAGIASLIGLFDLMTDVPVFSPGSFNDLLANIFQSSAAIIGILGAFLVYSIDATKNRILEIREDMIETLPHLPLAKIFANDEEFAKSIALWSDISGDTPGNRAYAKLSYTAMTGLMTEEKKIKTIATNQFFILAMNMFFALMLLIWSGGLDLNTGFMKAVIYALFSLAITSLLSALYGVYRVIYPERQS
jgi:hypothetical protein